MLTVRLVLRALRWRAAASITVFVVAVIAVLSATVGPIYLHATDQVVLTQRLQDTPPSQRDMVVTRDTLAGVARVDWREPVSRFARQAADPRWFGRPVFAEHAATTVTTRSPKTTYDTRILAIDSQCQHLTFTAGRCPRARTETAVSARAAATGKWRVGDRVVMRAGAAGTPLPLTVAGIYQPRDPHGAYWSPWHFFDAAPQLFDNRLGRLDSFFVVDSLLSTRIRTIPQTIEADVPLVVDRVGLDDRADLRASLRAVERAVADDTVAEAIAPTKVNTQLPTVLKSLNHEMSLAGTLVTLATAQLALLAVCVLYAIVAATAAVRGPEVALAKLRGRRPASILFQALLEPAILILTAAVAGAALAWVVVRLVSPRLLAPDAVVAFPRAALAVAALATAAALLAAFVAARRIVVSPVADLLRRGRDAATGSTGLAVADAAAVTIALAGLLELAVGGVLSSGKPDPLSVLAPALLAIAVAIVGLRLLPFVGRAVLNATRESRHLVTFLAVRQIVRRAAGARLVLLISVALALATFAVTNWSVARSNRQIRALNQTGAARVLTVAPRAGVDLRAAVGRADPGGRAAMAAEVVQVGNTPLLALDTPRMPGIAAWRADYSSKSASEVRSWLRPQTAPPVVVRGQQVRVDIDLTRVQPSGAAIIASLTLSDPAHRPSTADLGRLRPGRASYRGSLSPDCAAGCRVVGLQVEPVKAASAAASSPTGHPEIEVAVHSVATADRPAGPWRPVAAGLAEAGGWRAGEDANVELSSRAGALHLTLRPDASTGQWPAVVPADLPASVPAVLASGTVSVYPGAASANASATGLDGNALALDGSVHAVTLPELDRVGALVDLTLAQRAMTDTALSSARYQVWLARSAPSDLTARLQAQGLRILSTDSSQRHLSKLDRTGPAFADSLFVVAAGAATVLAIGATVLGGLVTARRRSYELAALEAVGVAPRTLRRATAAEQGLLLAVGLVLGVLAGIAGAALALPSTPFFVSTDIGPPVEYGLPAVTLAGLGVTLVVVLAVTCALMARLIEGQATAGRLREAQQ